MLFNPLFLQNEGGNENIFMSKPGSLKKKGYLFSDIMKVYINESGKANSLNSKINLNGQLKIVDGTAATENILNGQILFSADGSVLANENNVTAETPVLTSSPTVIASLSKLENILAKLLGNQGQNETGSLDELIKQLISKLNNKGEIVLTVEENGEKVAVGINKSEIEKNQNNTENIGNSTINGNYEINILTIPPNLNLSDIVRQNGTSELNEIIKVATSNSSGTSERVVTVLSLDAKIPQTNEVVAEPDTQKNGGKLNSEPVLSTIPESSSIKKSEKQSLTANGKSQLPAGSPDSENEILEIKAASDKNIYQDAAGESKNTNGNVELENTIAGKVAVTKTGKDKLKNIEIGSAKISEVNKKLAEMEQKFSKSGGSNNTDKSQNEKTVDFSRLKENSVESLADSEIKKDHNNNAKTEPFVKSENINKLESEQSKIKLNSTTKLNSPADKVKDPSPKVNIDSASKVKIYSESKIVNQTANETAVINAGAAKNDTTEANSKIQKEFAGAQSSEKKSFNSVSDVKTVESKEYAQTEYSQEKGSNTNNEFSSSEKNKTLRGVLNNIQATNIEEKHVKDFSQIFDKAERVVKTTEIVKEFSQFIKKKEKTQLVLQLDPAKLGKIKITLDVAKEIIKAHIEVESNGVKQTVQNNLPDLYSQLNRAGINLGSVSITLHDNANREAKQFTQKRKTNSELNSSEDFIEEEEKLEAKKLGYNTYEYLA